MNSKISAVGRIVDGDNARLERPAYPNQHDGLDFAIERGRIVRLVSDDNLIRLYLLTAHRATLAEATFTDNMPAAAIASAVLTLSEGV